MRVLDNLMRFKHRSSASSARRDLLYIFLLLVVVSVTTLVRLHLLPVPLERDEGEYAYVGQLMLQGVPPSWKPTT